MAIIVNLDVMMAKRKMSLNELSEKVNLTLANLSILKTGKAKAIRFSTLDSICKVLDCQPGDILEYSKDNTFLEIICKRKHWDCKVLIQHFLMPWKINQKFN